MMDSHVVCKFSSLADEFVRIRLFGEEDLTELLRMKETPSRRGFIQLVATACVLDYSQHILTVSAKRSRKSPTEIEEHFYRLAIDVNPRLDINTVTIPMSDGAREQRLHLLNAQEDASLAEKDPELLRAVADLEERICERVIGQEHAVCSVARAIQKATLGLRDLRRPIGTFLFVGQTGVGKTELAKALSACLLRRDDGLVRIDCSELALPHEYAKLIGAPPGYVGHGEGGFLSEMPKKGQFVLLFDEIEKAHGKVHNLLLQILDEGNVTDARGHKISFRDAVIILTSNIGVDRIDRHKNLMGFDSRHREPPSHEFTREATLASLKSEFRPEFINRIDEVVLFRSLSRTHCLEIVGRILDDVSSRARTRDITLVFTRRAREHLVKAGSSEEYGARELRRTVRELVEDPLTERILAGEIHDGTRVCVDVRQKRMVFHSGRR
jgi:ATP-dependent Clp protease ATP-binding subunit ClpC